MNTQKISVVFASLLILTGLSVSAVYGDHPIVDVDIPPGAGIPSCAETDECYTPSTVTVGVGGEVTWTNSDAAVHTVTAGINSENDTGNNYPNGFDSGIFAAGLTFTNMFEVEGEYPYFCIVHPWMIGTVIVGDAAHGDKMMDDVEYSTMEITSLDDFMVEVSTSDGSVGSPLSIELKILDIEGKVVPHVEYTVTATQGENILLVENSHEHVGSGSYETSSLTTSVQDTPIDIEVMLTHQGEGHEGQYEGPTGVVAQYQVVPEFGTIAIMILAVAIVSIIAISSRMNIVSRI